MKISISISGDTPVLKFDSRFGRASNFYIMDTETENSEVIVNTALSAPSGAGVEAAQLIAKHGSHVVISGAFGPKAYDTLAAAEIKMYLAPSDKDYDVSEIVEMFKNNKLLQAEGATHKGYHGENK